MTLCANLDSGGGRVRVGDQLSHASLGSPYSTSRVTAGMVDILYPVEVGAKPDPTPTPLNLPAMPALPSGVGSMLGSNAALNSPNKKKSSKPKKTGLRKTSKKSGGESSKPKKSKSKKTKKK